MHRVFRHFIAALVCIMIFSLTGTIDGFLQVLKNTPNPDPSTSLAFTGLLNFFLVSVLTLVVLSPVTSIADYLFTHTWSVPFYIQLPALVPLLILYLLPWSLLFGSLYFTILTAGTVALTIPLILYCAVFRVTDRDFAS